MADIDQQKLLQSPKFRALNSMDKLRVWRAADPDFAKLPVDQQARIMARLVSPDPKSTKEPDPGVLQTLKEGALGLAQFGTLVGAAGGPTATPADYMRLGQAVVDPQLEEAQKAKKAKGFESFGHGLAAATPLVGPFAAKAGEDIGEGRFRQGLTEAGELLAPAAMRALPLPSAMDVLAETGGATREGIRTARQAPETRTGITRAKAFAKGAGRYWTQEPFGPENGQLPPPAEPGPVRQAAAAARARLANMPPEAALPRQPLPPPELPSGRVPGQRKPVAAPPAQPKPPLWEGLVPQPAPRELPGVEPIAPDAEALRQQRLARQRLLPPPTEPANPAEPTSEADISTNRKNLNRHLNATPEIKERSQQLAKELFGKESRADLTSAQLQQIWEKINEGKKWDPRHPERNKSLEERAATRVAQSAGQTPETSGEGSLLDQLQASLDKVAQDAKGRMDQRGTFKGTRLGMNVPVDDVADMALWGAARIAQGATTFAKFSKQILADAGPAAEQIRPQLDKIWKDANKWNDRMTEKMAGNLTSTAKLLKLYREGKAGQDWYKYTRVELEKYFGDDASLFVDMLAATSPNTSVAANVTQALKAYQQFKSGQPFTGFMPAVIGNLDRLIREGEPPSGPKVTNFKANLFGNTEAVTVDRWMMRALGWPGKMLTPAQYKFFDAYLTQVARKVSVEPRQMQAAIWKAIKESEQVQNQTSEAFEDVLRRNMEKKPELRGLLDEISRRRNQPPAGDRIPNPDGKAAKTQVGTRQTLPPPQ